MNKAFARIFGGTIAFILLALYAWLVFLMVAGARNAQGEFNEGVTYIVTTIGGLVSALVISRLAITKPGENPAIFRMLESDEGRHTIWVASLAVLYLAVWLATGLSALIFGVILYPDINDTLSDIGTTWLGLAVAAGYAYFGVDPK